MITKVCMNHFGMVCHEKMACKASGFASVRCERWLNCHRVTRDYAVPYQCRLDPPIEEAPLWCRPL